MPGPNATILAAANARVLLGDYDGFLAYCTDDTHWEFIGEQTLDGKEAVRQYMHDTYIEPPVFHADEYIETEDTVTVIGEISIKWKSGRVTRSAYCDVWRIRDGKLAGVKAFVVELK
jgi:uncharacterized protein